MPSAAHQSSPLDELLSRGEDARLEVVDGLLCRIETSGEHADAQAGVLSAVRGSYHRSSGGDVRGGGWWIVDPAREFAPAPAHVLVPDHQRLAVAEGIYLAVEEGADGLPDQLPVRDAMVIRDLRGGLSIGHEGKLSVLWQI